MSGARTMQELKYFRDGATLVISLDGFNWLPKKRCSDKEIKKRNEELQLFISSDQMVQADEKLQTITCILDQRGTASSELWRKSDCRSSLVTSPKPISTPPQHQTSTLTSFVSFVPDYPKDTPWTRLILSMQDIFSLIKRDSNMVTPQDCVTMNQLDRFIIFCDEDIPLQRFGDITAEDCWTSKGDTDWHFSDTNMLSDLKNFTAHASNTKNSNRNTHELVIRDSFNNLKSLLKSYQICDSPGELSRTNMDVKRRKSVSFHEEVIVFLFDQESPTMELNPEACTSLPDVTLEDSGLEWEDDFSALEKNCHFQCDTHSQPHTLSLPTPTTAALSRHLFLSQTCLFLTHVTEADLEP
ncbi:Serine/threonine-protein kinase LMTK2 [Dissostichus eleginoides]|uniref:Serine/threonine-protein kinase LMTK2 n=1 Tax=Dissostichus eleginoides TaxID=100907 RepID=A0AAD9EXJ9_DISEL|nr:Serine/threonine-protein kinase LMTK2 [Dissostichus eleginoides]